MNRVFLAIACVAGVSMPDQVRAENDWRAEADRRIDRIRKSDFTVTVFGPDGKALADDEVRVEQIRSGFRWGVAINGDPNSDKPLEVKYRRFILDHFNTLVGENHFKWYTVEKHRDKLDYARADAYMRFADKHGLEMRGHCLFWSKKKWTQKWAWQLDPDELREEIDEHIGNTVSRYRGRLIAWDVNNEMLDGHFFKDKLGPQIRVHMFKEARKHDPDVPLYVNEYAILGSDDYAAGKSKKYVELIRRLREAGAPVTGIGIQEHACERILPEADDKADDEHVERENRGEIDPRVVWSRLDALGAFGLPIHITEVSARADDPVRRGKAIVAFMRACFAHESVDAFLLWGFWERRHWLGRQASLTDPQMDLNEAGRIVSQALRDEWRTKTTAATGPDGQVAFRGFHGTYRISAGGRSATCTLDRKNPSATVRLAEAEDAGD